MTAIRRWHLLDSPGEPANTEALVAQGIEHWFPKPCVAGSNPAEGTLLWSVTNPTPLGRPEGLWDCEELTRDRSAQFNKTQGT
jgi:hypothetical protein